MVPYALGWGAIEGAREHRAGAPNPALEGLTYRGLPGGSEFEKRSEE